MALLATIGFFLDSIESIVLPLTTILFLFILLIDFILTRKKIKNGEYMKIGANRKNSLRNTILISVFGIIWIILGIFRANSSINFLGIDINCYSGFIFVVYGFLKIENYVILIRNNEISFIDDIESISWRISKIEKVIIKNMTIAFTKKGTTEEYVANNPVELVNITSFLKNKFKDKLIIEN